MFGSGLCAFRCLKNNMLIIPYIDFPTLFCSPFLFIPYREEGKYKNNVLVTSNQKRHLFLIRSAKFRERIESAINAAQRASKIALQKADIAISRFVNVETVECNFLFHFNSMH